MTKRNIPTALADSFYEIDVKALKAAGIKVILSDLDNTLVPYGSDSPITRPSELVKKLSENGIQLIICSNGLGKRVRHYAELLGVEAAYFMRKPLAGPLKRLLKEKGLDKKEVILIGDQIQTDVRAGNGAGIRVILTKPLAEYEPIWTKVNRLFEKPKRKKIEANQLAPSWEEVFHE